MGLRSLRSAARRFAGGLELPGVFLLVALFFLSGCASLRSGRSHPAPPLPLAEVTVGERLVGAYVYGGVWQGLDPVHDLEEAIGHTFAINHWFTNWNNPWEPELVAMVRSRGSIPLITWQNNEESLSDIASGEYDAYIRRWARGAKAARTPVYLRLFPEMNGNWVPWNGDPETLKVAWRRVVRLFRDVGASNVRFVWSPNVTDQPVSKANRMENYYPGDQYVDILALDGYNWGTTKPWTRWRSFEQIFTEPYRRISAIGPQPIWFAELSSAEHGGDKGKWVEEMLSSYAFPRLEAIVWFSEHKDVDWRIQSSRESLQAFRAWFADLPEDRAARP